MDIEAVDKRLWADGPWCDEPDELVWIDQDSGYHCAILRHPEFGTLCGYVQVPKEHLLYGMGTSDRVEMLRDNVELHDQAPDFMGMLCEALDPDAQDGTVPISSAILVHGGVSFAGDLSSRLNQPQLEGWWFGFDCAHGGDMLKVPMMDELTRIAPSMSRGEYRDIDYVRKECASLARQLKARE